MARKFAKITFTSSVKAAQTRYGSRAANERFELAPDGGNTLGEAERDFIEARDGFYQATVGQSGWPYVQFRGGPAGFLKVLDERTIGYADFRGNVQYLSVGNLAANRRIALILMDYPNRRRLKVWATARIVHHDEDPDLLARLEVPTYRARVERAIVLTVEAVDWNCPQHITPRFTQDQISELVAPFHEKIAELEASASAPPTAPVLELGPDPVIGEGLLELVISGVRQLTPEIRSYELRRPDSKPLPKVAAGSHIEIPVPGAQGKPGTRTYSITGSADNRDAYEIAVRLDPEGEGGSRAIHQNYSLGLRICAKMSANAFALHDDIRPAVLIAGGIGITPLKAMAQELKSHGRSVDLHYAARSMAHMAYRPELAATLGEVVKFYPGDEGKRIDIEALLTNAASNAVFYVCGPERLIDTALAAAEKLGIDKDRVRFERFAAIEPRADDAAIAVYLSRSQVDLTVARDQSILDAVLDAGIDAQYSCKSGNCGTCAVKVLGGTPDHRDDALSHAERDQAGLMCICVSRAAGQTLTLDL